MSVHVVNTLTVLFRRVILVTLVSWIITILIFPFDNYLVVVEEEVSQIWKEISTKDLQMRAMLRDIIGPGG